MFVSSSANTPQKSVIKLALIYLATVAVLCIMVFSLTSTWLNHHLETSLHSQKSRLHGILSTHKKITEQLFQQEIITPEVITLARKMHTATDDQLIGLREELYSRLANAYKWMKCFGIRQLHFHSADGHSLLRFHARERFGDDLSAARPSLLEVRKTRQPVHGYESGRIVHGFRHVFPLIDGNAYLGSVEISQSIRRIVSDLGDHGINQDKILYSFILKKSDLRNKLFPGQTHFYKPSLISEDYCCGNIEHDNGRPLPPPQGVSNLNEQLHREIHRNEAIEAQIAGEKDFILYPVVTDKEYAVYFHSIKNINNEHAAYLIMALNEDHLSGLYSQAATGVAIVALLLIVPFNYRYQFERERHKRLQTAEFLEVVSQNMGEGVYATDTSGRITFINQASCDLLELNAEEVVGENAHNTFHDGHALNKKECLILKALETPEQTYKGAQQYRKKDGALFPVEFLSRAMSHDKKVLGVVTVFRDISDQQAKERRQQELTQQLEHANKKLSHLARIDALTEIANRRTFDEDLATLWRGACRDNKPLSLLMIDIDHFKAYNDHYGHPAGDTALKTVAKILLAACKRPGDTVTRYGGEEFAILLPDTTLADALLVGKRIQMLLSNHKIAHNASSVSSYLTVSIGAASCATTTDGRPQNLVDSADKSLYQAKISGRNQIHCNDDGVMG